jgi:hypothetical protein
MITKYHNRVEATEETELEQAYVIVRKERDAGKSRFYLKPLGNLRAMLEYEELDTELMLESLAKQPYAFAGSIMSSLAAEKKLYRI